jgi:hypothetical protein
VRYYYNGEWYSYEYLHTHYGITKVQSTPITLYDDSLNEFAGWEDDENNTWIINDGRWYSIQELPYYYRTQLTSIFYLIDKPLELQIYNLRDQRLYLYNNRLYSYSYLNNNFGITLTPSEVYYAKDGNIKCWYNPDTNLYWDTDSLQWLNYAPRYDGGTIDFDDINDVGAMGLFMFHSAGNNTVPYGTLVSGDKLSPICLRFPVSGEFTCTQVNTQPLTGTWRLLTATAVSSILNPCIVFAMKVSNESIVPNEQVSNTNTGNAVEFIEYNF